MNCRIPIASLALILVAAACRGPAPADSHPHDEENWSVTAWGEDHEIFAEVGPLVPKQACSETM